MTGIVGAGPQGPDPLEVVSIADAAADCGVTVETFVGWMVDSGMLLEHPNGGYIPVPHPAIQLLRGR